MDVYTSATDTTPTTYYYVLNLQGDVIQLRTAAHNVVANYTYDAWGKVLSVTNAYGNEITTANHYALENPLRYRGYFYDTETGFYYCNSRYYDPAMRRFINADWYVSTGQGFGGFNMYAYCGNNPTNRIDILGLFWADIKDWVVYKYEEAKSWVNSVFGSATYITYSESSESVDYLIGGFDVGVCSSLLIKGDDDKPIVIYAEIATNADGDFDVKVGINVNYQNSSVNASFGKNTSVSYTTDNISYGISYGGTEVSMNASYSTTISDDLSKSDYIDVYARPGIVATGAVIVTLGAPLAVKAVGASAVGTLVYSLA